jgi:hypothetical protein
MNKSFSSKYFERLKGSLLVDLRLPWNGNGASLDGVNVAVFQHFKTHLNQYLHNKEERKADSYFNAFYEYVVHDMSRLPTVAEVHKEAFEFVRVQLLSSSTLILERTIKVLNHLVFNSNDSAIHLAISQRLFMKTLSIVGRRQHEQGNHSLATVIFLTIKSWAMKFEDQKHEYPYIWGTYVNLRDKHGVSIPETLLKDYQRKSSGSSTSAVASKKGSFQLFASTGELCQTLSSSDDYHETHSDNSLEDEGVSEASCTMIDFEDDSSIDFPIPFGQHKLQSRPRSPSHDAAEDTGLSVSPTEIALSLTKPDNQLDNAAIQEVINHLDGKIESHNNSWVTIESGSSTPSNRDPMLYNSSFGSYESETEGAHRGSQNFGMPDIYVESDLLVLDLMAIGSNSGAFAAGLSMKVHTTVDAIPEEDEMGSTFYSTDASLSGPSVATSPRSRSDTDGNDTDDDTVFRYLCSRRYSSKQIINHQASDISPAATRMNSFSISSDGSSTVINSPLDAAIKLLQSPVSPPISPPVSSSATRSQSTFNSRIPKAVARRKSFMVEHSEDTIASNNKSTSNLAELASRILKRKGSKIPQLKQQRRRNSTMSILSMVEQDMREMMNRPQQKKAASASTRQSLGYQHDPNKDFLSHTVSSQAKAAAKVSGSGPSTMTKAAENHSVIKSTSASVSRARSKYASSYQQQHRLEKRKPCAIWL